jgi:hypothetical protein
VIKIAMIQAQNYIGISDFIASHGDQWAIVQPISLELSLVDENNFLAAIAIDVSKNKAIIGAF